MPSSQIYTTGVCSFCWFVYKFLCTLIAFLMALQWKWKTCSVKNSQNSPKWVHPRILDLFIEVMDQWAWLANKFPLIPGSSNFSDWDFTKGVLIFLNLCKYVSECQILWSLCSVDFHSFCTAIAYSNSTFCGTWTPSFCEFTWKLSTFQQNEHTPT